jgi:hypothetical protein
MSAFSGSPLEGEEAGLAVLANLLGAAARHGSEVGDRPVWPNIRMRSKHSMVPLMSLANRSVKIGAFVPGGYHIAFLLVPAPPGWDNDDDFN